MSDFTGLPPAAQAKATQFYSIGSQAAPDPGETAVFRKLYLNGGSERDLCLWHGFDGRVNGAPTSDVQSRVFSGSRYDKTQGWSVDAIKFGDVSGQFRSYVACDGYAPGHTHAWHYFGAADVWNSSSESGIFSQYAFIAPVQTLPTVTASGHFCWLTGIGTNGPYVATMVTDRYPPDWTYYAMAPTSAGIQCVSYAQ